MLSENGQLLMNATGGLLINPYAWTKIANLLVFEAPVGVWGHHKKVQLIDIHFCKCLTSIFDPQNECQRAKMNVERSK